MTGWCMICHPYHPLAGRASIRLADLEGEHFISFEPDQPTRKVIDRNLREQGVQVRHAIEFDNVETVKRAVEIENGISIVPSRTVRQEVENAALVAVEIAHPAMTRPLGILTRREGTRPPLVREFVALVAEAGAAAVDRLAAGPFLRLAGGHESRRRLSPAIGDHRRQRPLPDRGPGRAARDRDGHSLRCRPRM